MDGLHHSKQSKKARSRSRVRVHHTMVERSSPLIEGLQNEPEQSTSSLLLPTSIFCRRQLRGHRTPPLQLPLHKSASQLMELPGSASLQLSPHQTHRHRKGRPRVQSSQLHRLYRLPRSLAACTSNLGQCSVAAAAATATAVAVVEASGSVSRWVPMCYTHLWRARS